MHVQDVLPRDAIPGIDDPSFGRTYFGAADDDVSTPTRPARTRFES